MMDYRSRPKALPARDAVAALESAGGDAALAQELLAALLDGLPAEIEALRACVEESDWAGLAEHAHQMRGATRYCGVPALDDAIEALERAAQMGDPLRISSDFSDVQAHAERLAEESGA